MLDARATVGFCLAAAGLIVLSASLADIGMRPGAQPSRPSGEHPLAALAWSEAHCDSRLMLRLGTPRLQMEDLLRLSAAYDDLALRHGRESTCAHTEALAAAIAIPAPANANTHLASAPALQSP